ncbi:hypothetical protein P7K49_029942 [Saguinus oedipus]|uniref:Uncharacterized protein n=1 Tax=Saguinus oedipus TaxID=9490 RepID=A0ABQ9U9V3_SAGOE|nr:hypothetical protein P7K49_029942 [Saguinus oedipus]
MAYGSRDEMAFNSSGLCLGKATPDGQQQVHARCTELTTCSSDEQTGRTSSIHIRVHVTSLAADLFSGQHIPVSGRRLPSHERQMFVSPVPSSRKPPDSGVTVIGQNSVSKTKLITSPQKSICRLVHPAQYLELHYRQHMNGLDSSREVITGPCVRCRDMDEGTETRDQRLVYQEA